MKIQPDNRVKLRVKRLLSRHKTVKAIRQRLSVSFFNKFGGAVKYGNLSGLRISKNTSWGYADLTSKLFGLYEQEVLSEICRLSRGRDVFIDIGAADGFFAIGLLKNKFFNKCYAFESSKVARDIISATANLNQVSDKLVLLHSASTASIEQFSCDELSKACVLIDIEGGEFGLLTDNILHLLQRTPLVIEVHDFLVENGDQELDSLLIRAEKFFHVRQLQTGISDLTAYEELASLSDDERWLICSEGQPCLGRWLVLEPRIDKSEF